MNPPSDSESRSAAQTTYRILLALFALYLLVLVKQRVVWWADGGYQFLGALLSARGATLVFDEPLSNPAVAAMRLPSAVATWSGVRDMDALYWFFAVGLVLHFVVMLGVCALAAGRRWEFMLFPLASFFVASANTSFFTWHPAHFMVSVFWTLLFALLLPLRWSVGWAVTALGVASVGVTAYESMAVFGIILAAAAVYRAWKEGPRWTRVAAVAVGLLCLYGVVKSLASVGDAGVGHYITYSLPLVDGAGKWHGSLVLSLIGAALLVSCRTRFQRPWRVGLALLALGSVLWLLTLLLAPEALSVYVHYMARTVNLSGVLLIAATFLYSWLTASSGTDQSWRLGWQAVAVVGIMQTAWLTVAASHWRAFLDLVSAETQESAGLRDFEETRLGRPTVNGKPVAAFVWSWSMPTMSLLVAPGGGVRSIVANPAHYEGWQPFDPERLDSLPALQTFGIDYDEYVDAMRARVANPDQPH